jgi:hypothetical protein
MTYGGSSTKRPGFSFARIVGLIGEAIGLLNKGSASAPAAPGGGSAEPAVSANSLNVTRVGGVGALISGAGGAALVLFHVNKMKDPHSEVVAAYISIGVIVAASLVAVAMIIVADIRSRTGLASAAVSASVPAPEAQVKYIQTVAAGTAEMAVSLDRAYDFVIVNATATGLKLTLPTANSATWQQMSIKREDNAGDKVVTLLAQNRDQVLGEREHELAPANPVQLYSNGESWLAVQ